MVFSVRLQQVLWLERLETASVTMSFVLPVKIVEKERGGNDIMRRSSGDAPAVSTCRVSVLSLSAGG